MGIVEGREDGTFGGESPVSRGEMAVFLTRALSLAPGSDAPFSDVDPSLFYNESVDAIRTAGITIGCGDNRFCPSESVTRHDMALFLTRAFHLELSVVPVRLSPLDGLPASDGFSVNRRIIAVKIDNAAPARPQSGIEKADAMIELMVEGGLSRMMAPAMVGMSVGSMIGRLATRAFGTHDLPIPRQPSHVTLVPTNIDEFATQWEIPGDEMRLWVLAHEIAGFTLFEAAHVRDTLSALVREHVGGFRPDANAVTEKLGSLDMDDADPMAALQRALNDPELLLGAVTSKEQQALRPRLDALVAVVVGYTDWVVDAVAVRLVGGDALRIAEAVRRQRAETSASDAFVEQLLGIRIGADQVARGKAFVQGVIDRAGDSGMLPMLERSDAIPTPAEVDAPGLWLARING